MLRDVDSVFCAIVGKRKATHIADTVLQCLTGAT